VKLGGSHEIHVPALAEIFRRQPRPLLIVPGGGRFADAVRSRALDDDDAHWTAIRAMDRFGSLLAASRLPSTEYLAIPLKPTVLLPYRCCRDSDPLPHSWDVTSDTIAAWVAGRLGTGLLILKSVDGIPADDGIDRTIVQNVETDVVDPCCIPYILEHGIRATVINGTLPDRVADFLRGKTVPCTRIGTTF
jgi:aspartokinase-like uncharacterized kinase